MARQQLPPDELDLRAGPLHSWAGNETIEISEARLGGSARSRKRKGAVPNTIGWRKALFAAVPETIALLFQRNAFWRHRRLRHSRLLDYFPRGVLPVAVVNKVRVLDGSGEVRAPTILPKSSGRVWSCGRFRAPCPRHYQAPQPSAVIGVIPYGYLVLKGRGSAGIKSRTANPISPCFLGGSAQSGIPERCSVDQIHIAEPWKTRHAALWIDVER